MAVKSKRAAEAEITLANRLAQLEEEAKHARRRYQLYKAKAYGPRQTDPAKLRQMRTAAVSAELRLGGARRNANV